MIWPTFNDTRPCLSHKLPEAAPIRWIWNVRRQENAMRKFVSHNGVMPAQAKPDGDKYPNSSALASAGAAVGCFDMPVLDTLVVDTQPFVAARHTDSRLAYRSLGCNRNSDNSLCTAWAVAAYTVLAAEHHMRGRRTGTVPACRHSGTVLAAARGRIVAQSVGVDAWCVRALRRRGPRHQLAGRRRGPWCVVGISLGKTAVINEVDSLLWS
jgi:hypothetical protein